jgi:hypothetical protein
MVLNATFNYISVYIVAVSFISGGNRRISPTCRKSLTNFFTECCVEFTPYNHDHEGPLKCVVLTGMSTNKIITTALKYFELFYWTSEVGSLITPGTSVSRFIC